MLLDVQRIIPLPEAAEYQVRLREKEQRERVARESTTARDYTKYTVKTIEGVDHRLPKRRAILSVVKGLVATGVQIDTITEVLETNHGWGSRVMRSAPGNLDDRSFLEAIREDRPDGGPEFNPDRYFCSQHELIRTAERTYALTNQW